MIVDYYCYEKKIQYMYLNLLLQLIKLIKKFVIIKLFIYTCKNKYENQNKYEYQKTTSLSMKIL